MAGDGDDLVREQPRTDTTSFQYPFAAAPDIIRSNQKDQYFQSVLLEQLTSILRKMYGSRFVHTYTSEARTFSELLYLGLTTFVGNRTLGEEYTDIVQVEDSTMKLPSIRRRAGYITAFILLPYALDRTLPSLRHRLSSALESSLASTKTRSSAQKLARYTLANLDTLTSPNTLHALSLATFYFSGAYYHLSKRLCGLRYIFARQPPSSTDPQRAGYEVLGVLLVLQLAVQGYLHLRSTTTNASSPPQVANPGTALGTSAVLGAGVEVSLDPMAYSANNTLLFESTPSGGGDPARKTAVLAHTPMPDGPRYDLRHRDTMAWIQGRQGRKCTLCLEELKDPAVTSCGHVFCWADIVEWCREKAECPLCRQASLVQKILPLRG